METVFGLAKAGAYKAPVATLGVFDGVHLGHKRVLAHTVDWASRLSGTAVVITFDRHPERVVKGSSPDSITSLEHRLHLISQAHLDVCIVLHFGADLACTEPEDFAKSVFVKALGVRGLVLGYNCRFGRGGAGTSELLEEIGSRHGFEVQTVEPLLVDGQPVSSTRIRRLVETGDLKAAASLLGRPFTLRGTVVHGKKRGRRLGFPTANLNLHHEATPPSGVYISKVELDGQVLWGLTNVGVRPTFTQGAGAVRKTVEVYVQDYEGGDLYGRTLEVEPLCFLRSEEAFESPAALTAQIEQDTRMLATFRRELDDPSKSA